MKNMKDHEKKVDNTLNLEIERLNSLYELVSNAYTLKLIGRHKFKKAMLIEGKKTDNEIDKYIEILLIFEENTYNGLIEQFNFIDIDKESI